MSQVIEKQKSSGIFKTEKKNILIIKLLCTVLQELATSPPKRGRVCFGLQQANTTSSLEGSR